MSAEMRIAVLTIFPDLVEAYVAGSVIGRARHGGALDIAVHDIRDGADDARRTVDDAPFGGGAGMVLAPGPIFAVAERADVPRPVIMLGPSGRRFDQGVAAELVGLGAFTLVCGRYEGIDQRVADHLCDDEISIGDVVLAGGELAALVVAEAVCRLVPGVLGNAASVRDESFAEGLLEYPQYTRPATFRSWSVPDVLLGGDHGAVDRWRRAESLRRTLERRPDLIASRGGLSADEVELLAQHGYPRGTAAQERPGTPASDAGDPLEEREPT